MEELAADFPPGSQGVAHLVLTFQPGPAKLEDGPVWWYTISPWDFMAPT
jgi:hypothetical protein